MLLKIAGIDRPNPASSENISPRRTRQQTVQKGPRSESVPVVTESKLRESSPSPLVETAIRSPSTKSSEAEEAIREFSTSERNSEKPISSEPEDTTEDNNQSKAPGGPCEPVSSSADSQSSLPLTKPQSHRVNFDRKAQRQILAIQKAIKVETRDGKSKANTGILKGLKTALRKLTTARRRSGKTHSVEPEASCQLYLPTTPKEPARELLQTTTLLETPQPDPTAPAHEPSVAASATRNNMGYTVSRDGEESQENSSVAVDQDMKDVEDVEQKVFTLTDECQHYTSRADVTWDIQKYWAQRYSIFSLYDEGIHMTDDSWFGVTPEPVAAKVAEDLAAVCSDSKTILIDMFAGAGGNVIAFALSNRWSKIIAIEKEPSVIACAQHNAAIYEVFDRITWISADSFSYLKSNASSIDPSKTVIFASPPWGGPGYTADTVFNLHTMAPYSIKQIYEACKTMDTALYLPRNSDLRQIAKLAPDGKKVEVVQYCMQGASKALVAYIPAIGSPTS